MLYIWKLGHLKINTITKNAYNVEWDTLDANHCFKRTIDYICDSKENYSISYKFRWEFEPWRKTKHFKSGQGTYKIPMSIQLKWSTNQTHGVPSRVIVPISRPQKICTTLITTTQTNIFVGWPPPIPISYEG